MEEKYTIEEILDAIKKGKYEVIYALNREDGEYLEEVIRAYIKFNVSLPNG